MQVVRLLIAGSAMISSAALAHHSGAMFDPSKSVTITGVIKRYAYTNPHVWLDVEVVEKNGQKRTWSIEGGAPGTMKRVGLTPSVLRPGDRVTVTMSPLRDGRPGGSFRTVKLANGKIISATAARTDAIAPPKAGAERPSF